MKKYIGTKLVQMEPMTRQAYNDFRGWILPADENGDDAGYLVEYMDGGKPNTTSHAGYVSWSPAAQAEAAYRPADGMPFGLAIEAMKKGHKVTRGAWGTANVFVYYVPPAAYPVQTGAARSHFGDGALVPYKAYLAIKQADEQVCVFSPGMDSLLADDWRVVD